MRKLLFLDRGLIYKDTTMIVYTEVVNHLEWLDLLIRPEVPIVPRAYKYDDG
jgi:hypothetical protein